MAPPTPTIIVARGLTCKSSSWSKLYLLCFSMIVALENMSSQYVNSMNCIMWVGGGANGIWMSIVAPWTHRMNCHSLAMQEHGVGLHVRLSSHSSNIIP